MSKDELITQIVDLELKDFISTNDEKNKSICQNHPENFILSRLAQWYIFDEEILSSYLQDIQQAHYQGRNIVRDKYAYIMALTNPIICHYLAEPSPHKKILSQQLTAMVIAYYQNLKAGGKTDYILKRPLYQHEETDQMISVESYLLGEYYTYSEETLIRILNYFNLCQKEKLNPIQKLLDLLMIEDYI